MDRELIYSNHLTAYLQKNAKGKWLKHNGTYDSIIWRDGETPSDKATVESGTTAIQTEYDAQAYARNRKADYPDWGTQLNKIYDSGIDKWKSEMVDPVKAKWPKDNSGPIE